MGTFLNIALLLGCVLMLGAASGYFSERVGIVNIGINGMMIFGALFFSIYSSFLQPMMGNESYFLDIILTGASTIIVGLLFGFATIILKADHIIVGTAINLLGAGLGAFLTSPLGFKLEKISSLKSMYEPQQILNYDYFGLYGETITIFFVIVALMVIIFLIMHFTSFGLRYRSIGENPNAADSQGISVYKYQWTGVILSSIFGGFAGSIFMLQTGGQLFNGNVSGLGFLSLAIMIIGAWRIPIIIVGAISFALLFSYSTTLAPIKYLYLYKMIPYICTMAAMLFFSKWTKAPAHDGIPFDKALR